MGSDLPRLFALADLHLSLGSDKPMDIFGEVWRDHTPRMASAWDGLVRAEDTVLLPGDLSWARTIAEAQHDLAWLGQRPGRKLLLRGNHDSWWSSLERVRHALPPSCEPLQNNALEANGWVIVGARGWIAPADPLATDNDAKIFRRELERLVLSVRYADRVFGSERPRLAMLHYPPWLASGEPTEVVDVLERARVRAVVYGHLHGADHALAVRGERRGIVYHFVAADAVGFAPVRLELLAPGSPVCDP